MSSTITFWKLIEGNKIEIPIIQRDYAQGREEDKVNSIRKEFVTDLISTLEEKEKLLHLGFLYGKIEGKEKKVERERNKRAIENILNAVEGYAKQLDMRITTEINTMSNAKFDNANLPIFFPLDGQQRLTTLFLLHWYLMVFSYKVSEINLKILNNFTYKTRKSSMEFCNALTQFDNVKHLKNLKSVLSESIQNQKWFRKIWMRDSTVKGMLVMLDEIHNQLSFKSNIAEILNRLLSQDSPSISFDFLDLNELNQTDELYVKMNARGKQLSEFEHFKAWLQNYVSTRKSILIKDKPETNVLLSGIIEEKDWKLKIDRTWLDLFWKNKGSGSFYVDNVIYNAFKQIALFEYIASNGKSVEEDVTKIIRENSYVPFSYYEIHDFFSAQTLNFLFKSLNELSNKDKMSQYQIWLNDITNDSFFGSKLELNTFYLKDDRTVAIPESVFYYSFLLFLNYSKKKDSETFKTWMRFTRNIIFNTYIQNPENFIDSVLSLKSIKDHIDTIDNYIMSPEIKVSFFGDIIKQENVKFKLMQVAPEWKEAIIRCENHRYFKGDIGFILEMSLVGNEYNYHKFIGYGEKAMLLFDDGIRNHPNRLLQRALLTHGDYLPKVGANYLIPLTNRESLRARRDNWQRIFNNEKYRNILKSLIDDIHNDIDFESQLLKMIDEYGESDWSYYFIKSRWIVDYCTQGFIRFENDNDILLLKTSRVYGKHAELRSYFIFKEGGIESKMPFRERKYWSNRMSQYSFPCIRYSGWEFEGNSYKLEITFKSEGKYLMQIVNEEKIKISEKISNYLLAWNWQISTEGTQCFSVVTSDAEIKSQITITLNNLCNIS